MKKLIILIITVLMVNGTAQVCRAEFKDISGTVLETLEVWVGVHGYDHSNSNNTSTATTMALPEDATRVPGNKAAEYYSLENFPSGGFLYNNADLPQRLHLEFDFYDVDDWYGDFRYSYLDYVQIRLLPRRFYHNYDNLTIYDWAAGGSGGGSILINDAGVDDYGIRIDIDQYKLRFKAPGFPLHLFSDGEYILKDGKRQQRFMGGSAYHNNALRVSESKDIDQEKLEYSLGINAHLGLVEVEGSRRWREFDSDASAPTYNYGIPGFIDTIDQVHNATPELEATIDTFKIHTSHSGRLFVSGTYSKVDKTNNSSTAEATNEMGYGELVWLPAGYISFTAKYRHQENKAESPATTTGTKGNGAFGPPLLINTIATYNVEPGVESTMETASLAMRYSLIPRTNLRIKYTSKSKEVEELSAIEWDKPLKTRKDIYEANLTNWAIPKTRVTAKFKHTHTDHKMLPYVAPVGFTPGITSANNEPDVINQGVLGLTIMASPKVAVFLNGNVSKESGNEMRQVIGADENHAAEALRQTYVASLTFIASEKLSFSPTYTYISFEQERDIVWEDGQGTHYIDHDYNNEQIAHNISLNMMYEPTERLSINASLGYTATEGSYDSPYTATFETSAGGTFFTFNAADVMIYSETDTQEINVRIDTEYDLGNSWGVGVDLRFTDWKDESFDNPYDGTYVGGMLKLTKKIM